MVPRENKNNAYAKSGGTNKEYYGILRNGLLLVDEQKELIRNLLFPSTNMAAMT